MTFCPLTKEDCNPDCAWRDEIVTMDEDGFTLDVHCAITIIAAEALMLNHGLDENGFENE